MDIEVMVMGGGKERTVSEFRELLKEAGFKINSVFNKKNSVSILECFKE